MRAYKTRAGGAALLEVLIAVVVIAFALVALVHFQGNLIQTSNHAKTRSLAMSLAQAKLDDLRAFTQLPAGGAGTFGFEEVFGDRDTAVYTGGREDNVGALLLPAGNRVEGNVTYTLTWVTSDLFNCGAGPDLDPACVPARPIPDVKVVAVTVVWDELLDDGTPNEVRLESVIHADDPVLSALSFLDAEREKPVIRHTPGTIPEVIPINIGPDLRQESSKPAPDTTQHELSTETQFDAVQYQQNTLDIYSRRDFVTVNCTCVQAGVPGSPTGRSPSRPPLPVVGTPVVLETGEGQVIAGKRVGEVLTGGPFNEQPFLCTACCRDHHDHDSQTLKYDPFRPSTEYVDGDHKHYNRDSDGNYTPADSPGQEYIEACRFQRINGILQVAQDWNLEKVNVLPNTFLSSNTSDYANYVAQFINEYIDGITISGSTYTRPAPNPTLANAPTEITFSNVNSPPQVLQARAIYIDWMTNAEIMALQDSQDDGLPILSRVPFFEVNITRLANWSVAAPTIATVTDEPIEDGNEATYSRGEVRPISAGTTSALATMERSNTGLTDSFHLSGPMTYGALSTSDDIPVVVSGTPPPPATITVTGSISIPGSIKDVSPSDVLVVGSNGAMCTKPTQSTYSCTLDATGSGTVTFQNYQGLDPANPHKACPMDTFNYSGATSNPTQDVTLKRASQNC